MTDRGKATEHGVFDPTAVPARLAACVCGMVNMGVGVRAPCILQLASCLSDRPCSIPVERAVAKTTSAAAAAAALDFRAAQQWWRWSSTYAQNIHTVCLQAM